MLWLLDCLPMFLAFYAGRLWERDEPVPSLAVYVPSVILAGFLTSIHTYIGH